MLREHRHAWLGIILTALLLAPPALADEADDAAEKATGGGKRVAEQTEEAEARGKDARKAGKKHSRKQGKRAKQAGDDAEEALEDAGEETTEDIENAAEEAVDDIGEDAEDAAAEGKSNGKESRKSADAAAGNGRGDEMRGRRDERKEIMEESRAGAEPDAPRKGKKPWYRFWESNDEDE